MTNFKGDYITKSDVGTAKNYLSEDELIMLNLLVSSFLDTAEIFALRKRSMNMSDWVTELDNLIINSRSELLIGKGTVSHKQALEKVKREFKAYRDKEMKGLVSDFDRAVRELTKKDE